MKTLLLCLLLTGCASMDSEPLTKICAVQVLKFVNDQTYIAREHCEPEGVKS